MIWLDSLQLNLNWHFYYYYVINNFLETCLTQSLRRWYPIVIVGVCFQSYKRVHTHLL